MTDPTHPVCSTSNCDNRATVKVADTAEPMLVCGSCWRGMMTVETVTIMSEADRAAARKLVSDWCDPKPPKGWEMREPGYFERVGEEHGSWVDVRDRYFRIGWRAEQMHAPVEIVDVALRSIIAGMAPALAGTLTAALDDGDALRGVIARAIEASNSIAARDAEDAIQEMLQHLLEAEPEGHDDRIEWARLEGANAMLEVIQREGYGARGIAMNRDALRKAAAELAVATTMPRNPEPEFEAALLQREVEQLRAQLTEKSQQHAACISRIEEMEIERVRITTDFNALCEAVADHDAGERPENFAVRLRQILRARSDEIGKLQLERDRVLAVLAEFKQDHEEWNDAPLAHLGDANAAVGKLAASHAFAYVIVELSKALGVDP